MKNIFKTLFVTLGIATLVGCEKVVEYNDTEVLPVEELTLPLDGATIEIYDTELASSEFSWIVPSSSNPQSYAITFYSSENSANEIYRIEVESGANTTLVQHTDLLKVAVAAGIAPNSQATIYWNVVSKRGEAEVSATVWNALTLIRPNGIDDIPANLYLGGVAENNDGVFRTLKNLGDGSFEIFAQLTPSEEFYFSSRNIAENCRAFYVNADEDGTLRLVEDGLQNCYRVENEGVYYIQLNLNSATATLQELTDVVLRGSYNSPMTYIGNGTYEWQGDNGSMVIPCEEYGRYRFDAVLDGTDIMIGSSEVMGLDEPTSFTGSYFDVFIYDFQWGVDRYNYTIPTAFRSEEVDYLILTLDGETYNHSLSYPDISINPITALNNPSELETTADTPYEIADASKDATYTFSWDVAQSDYTATYGIYFYATINGVDTKLHSSSVYGPTSYTMELSTLNTMVAACGVEPGEVIEFTWSVDGEVFGQTTAFDGRESFFVRTKLDIIPTELYLTGEGTEFTSEVSSAGRMRETDAATFEIYAELTAGKGYNFINSKDDGYTTFGLEDGVLTSTKEQISVENSGIYRIVANFAVGTVTLESIDDVQLCWNGNTRAHTLVYTGNGSWIASNADGNLISDTGSDAERYRFNATVDGVTEAWGYSRWNNDGPEVFHFEATDSSNDDKAPQLITIIEDINDDWAHTFKTDRNGSNNQHIVKLEVYMNGTDETLDAHYHVTLEWYGDDKPESSTHCTVL